MTDILERLDSRDPLRCFGTMEEAKAEIIRLRKLYRWWEQLYHTQTSEIERLREQILNQAKTVKALLGEGED